MFEIWFQSCLWKFRVLEPGWLYYFEMPLVYCIVKPFFSDWQAYLALAWLYYSRSISIFKFYGDCLKFDFKVAYGNFSSTHYVGGHCGRSISKKIHFLHFFKLVTKESLEQISSPSMKFSFPVNLFKKTHAWTRSKLCWLSKFSISRLWVTTCQVILLEKLKCRPLQASCTYFAHDRPWLWCSFYK